jgi:hypothetical protein
MDQIESSESPARQLPEAGNSNRGKKWAIAVVMVPIAAALIGGGFRVWEVYTNNKERQWEEVHRAVSEGRCQASCVRDLIPLLTSWIYGKRAREDALQALEQGNDLDHFDGLFKARFASVKWKNLNEVLDLDRQLLKTFETLWEKGRETKLSPDEKKTLDNTEEALKEICGPLALVLKSPRPSGKSLNFTGVRLWGCDCRGVDLSGLDITRASMIQVELKGASLGNIAQFGKNNFFKTAWWEAKDISPSLLAYLENDANNKYNESMKYGPREDTFTRQQYIDAVTKLEHPAP